MEDSSHELIDQLNAEEKYCYGFDGQSQQMTVSGNNNQEGKSQTSVAEVNQNMDERRTNEQSAEKTFHFVSDTTTTTITETSSLNGKTAIEVQSKNERVSATTQVPATHNQRWSTEEDALLDEAIEKFGYGHWNATSAHVKTRNPLQCKNRGRQKYVNKQKNTSKQNNTEVKKVENIHDHPDPGSPTKKIGPSLPSAEKAPITPPSDDMINTFPSTLANPGLENQQHIGPARDVDVSPVLGSTNIASLSPKEEQEIEFEVDPNEVSADERLQNAEWFIPGRTAKTPERYMRIRNHIIDCWKNSKPSYLTKTAGRKNLADCGDVNAVGRIHTYLESIHAINVNCSSPVKRVYGRRFSSAYQFDEDGLTRKKKAKKAPGYFWADVDIDEEEEVNPRHSLIIKSDGQSRPRRATKRRETFYNEDGNDFGQGSDPFTLVPVGYYPNDKSAPFTVDITSNALLVMDFHAHLAYTEIIGLLGGRVVEKEDGSQELKVEYVFPCRSTSTGTQCEMDPVSEMAAREVFEQKGLRVVGWYHSHPTFEPEPSIRDIENQTSYQDLFRDEASGIEPFIGVIITPYNSRNMLPDKSQFQFIHISKRWSINGAYRLPFACYQKVTHNRHLPQDIFEIFVNLIEEYKTYEHKINMNLQYGDSSRLEKLLRSLKNHLFMEPPENNAKFLTDLCSMMIQSRFVEGEVGGKWLNGSSNTVQNATLTQESQEKQMNGVVNSLAI